jgi:thymidylate kinase
VAVDGVDDAGKTTFADELAAALANHHGQWMMAMPASAILLSSVQCPPETPMPPTV